MDSKMYLLSDEGIKVLVEKISENIKESLGDKVSNDENEFLTISEVAKLIKLAVPTIYGLVNRNAIPYYKKGKRLYFIKREVLEWIKNGKRASKSDIEKQADAYLANNNLF